MTESVFDDLERQFATEGVDSTLVALGQRMRDDGRYHELFDVRLMQGRLKLGLPVILSATLDELPEPLRTNMEDAYVDACREVGGLFLKQGNVREAWRYLRPAGDKAAVADALESIEPADGEVEELIEVALQGAVNPKRGIELVIAHYGTCNAITMFEQFQHEWSPVDRQRAAARLVRHLTGELAENLAADIARREGKPPSESSIAALVEDRDWLFSDNNYHVDTSHLNAVVRFARLVDDPEVLRLAAELCEYGRRLSEQYQFPGEEPFADVYPAHRLFFRALSGEDVDAAVDYFRHRAESLAAEEHGTGPAEVYVALLARLGRTDEAIEASIRLIPTDAQPMGFAPSLLELSRQAGRYDRLLEACRQRGDVIGFTAGLIQGADDNK